MKDERALVERVAMVLAYSEHVLYSTATPDEFWKRSATKGTKIRCRNLATRIISLIREHDRRSK